MSSNEIHQNPELFIASDENFCNTICQKDPYHVCNKGEMFKNMDRKDGKKRVCRHPKCSFYCRRKHAQREAWIAQGLYKRLDEDVKFFRGCLKPKKEWTVSEYRSAIKELSRMCKAAGKKEKVIFRWRGYAHPTSLTDCHYDYTLYSDHEKSNWVSASFRKIAQDAGFEYCSCVEIGDEIDLGLWTEYMFKTWMVPKRGEEYMYLLARNGLDYVVGSHDYFRPWGRDEIWQEIVDDIKAANTAPTNFDQKDFEFDHIYDLLESDWEIDKMIKILVPWREEDAVTAEKIAWLMGLPYEYVANVLVAIPDIKWQGNKYYLPRDIKCRWEERWFPGGVPYHEEHFP